MANSSSELILRDNKIGQDEQGNICLTDLCNLAGSTKSNRPIDWYRSKRAQALEYALKERMVGIFHHYEKTSDITTLYTAGRGRASKTYAHPVLALDYAEYLDANLGVEVREVFLRFKSNDISLANDILDKIAEQVQEDEYRIKNRREMTLRNKELASEGKKAGCQKWQYGYLHNSGYRGLYNGLDEKGIHTLKGLTKSQKILDHMNAAEGAANVFRVTQARIAMQQQQPKTPDEAFKIAHDAGVETRKAMKRIGGIMPEDMEPADSINKAKKRLEINKPLIKNSQKSQ